MLQDDEIEDEEAVLLRRRQSMGSNVGANMNFQQVLDGQIGDRVENIKRSNQLDALMGFFLIGLSQWLGKDATCGVDLKQWNLVYSIIITVRACTNLIKVPLIRANSPYLQTFSIIHFIACDGLFLAWLIYGNVIFYSKQNNCNSLDGSKSIYDLTLTILIIGYFQMFVYALIIFLIPFFLIYRRNHFDNRPGGVLNGQAINQVVDSLTREKFSSGAFNNDLQCPICYVEYDPADEITQLSCDPKHYFHNHCIVTWISKGNNSCPMCRKEIKQMM